MPARDERPIACTLRGDSFEKRVAENLALARDGLIAHRRDGLRLTLAYSPAFRDQVSKMVSAERECCAFLTIDVRDQADRIELTLAVPAAAADVADDVFAQFIPAGATGSAVSRPIAKAAAMTAAAGAVACGVCCAVPIVWPALAAAGFGGTVAWLADAQREVMIGIALSLTGAWFIVRARRVRRS